MSQRTPAAALVLAASALALSGCGSSSSTPEETAAPTSGVRTTVPASKAAPVIQLRSVTASIDGACHNAPLLTTGAGPACSWDAKTSYQLGPKLADLTVTKAIVADEDAGGVSTGKPIVRVHLDETSTVQLSSVSKDLVGKTVAFLIGGRVVEAPIISAQIKNGDVAILPASPVADAQEPSPAEYTSLLHQVATALGAK
jgi:hypothetical protein